MPSDSYWHTHGGMEHKHKMFALDQERNLQLKRIADALEGIIAVQGAVALLDNADTLLKRHKDKHREVAGEAAPE